MNYILKRNGPFNEASSDGFDIPILGAGGLGCEILKNISMSGFKNIDIIDMDTIDISNLNRQFLFSEKDVGKPKAQVAVEKINQMVFSCFQDDEIDQNKDEFENKSQKKKKKYNTVKLTPHVAKIQDFDESFYSKFGIIVCGLDSVSARRWINATLVNMVSSDDVSTIKPLVDGGSEGFKGQSRVILPTLTSCYECSLDMLTPTTTYPICTIANTPRLPEHCIEWASVLEWPIYQNKISSNKDKNIVRKINADNPQDVEWVYQKAKERAEQFGILGVTYQLTLGVIKNIIPSVASTNAIIAASCANEVFKLATVSNPVLDNYMMYTGNQSIYTYTFQHLKKSDCPVCGNLPTEIKINPSIKFRTFLLQILYRLLNKDINMEDTDINDNNEMNDNNDNDTNMDVDTIKQENESKEWEEKNKELIENRMFARSSNKTLYASYPADLADATKNNLNKPISHLIEDGGLIAVSIERLPLVMKFIVSMKKK